MIVRNNDCSTGNVVLAEIVMPASKIKDAIKMPNTAKRLYFFLS
jgi:hypothetical protein